MRHSVFTLSDAVFIIHISSQIRKRSFDGTRTLYRVEYCGWPPYCKYAWLPVESLQKYAENILEDQKQYFREELKRRRMDPNTPFDSTGLVFNQDKEREEKMAQQAKEEKEM